MSKSKIIHVHVGGRHDAHTCELGSNETVGQLLLRLLQAGNLGSIKLEEIALFEEDVDAELPHNHPFTPEHHGKRFHAHRCREIEVTFIHVDQTAVHPFKPAATIRKLLRWAREKFKVDANTKFDLRLGGPVAEPLPLDAHLGSYIEGRPCKITLYFTPSCRIQG